MAEALDPGDVLLLENTRFEPGETKNDPELAERLADARRRSTSTTPSAPPTAPTPRTEGVAAPTCPATPACCSSAR